MCSNSRFIKKYVKNLSKKSKNVLSRILLRPWLGVPFGIWLAVSVAYYWWLISRISVLETQNKVFKTHLRMSQYAMRQLNPLETTTQMTTVTPEVPAFLCETIHIALVCMGKCTRIIIPMLKSLLHHRQNPLHFHLIVDENTERRNGILFDTWDLPDVKYSFYNAQKLLSQMEWIPNSHYSGKYSLAKLLFPSILPNTLSQVIVLDSDLTLICDIAELWILFKNMTSEQLLGLVENESDWYYQGNHWPALGRGYNTGVMLLHLENIRNNVNWDVLWHDTVNGHLESHKALSLGDQDIINAIIKNNPVYIYNISCQYNVQMSTKSLAKSCYGEDSSKIKIIHWNSPLKHNILIRDAMYFRSIHQSYVNYDGNLLREKMHRCSQTEAITYKMNQSDICLSFRGVQKIKLRTQLYYMEYAYAITDNFDVTLVLQLSMDRLLFLERFVKHWEGPVSAAIYLSDCDVEKLERFINQWSSTLSTRRNIGYHLVFKRDSVHYPVNYLRNVALENVNTPYVFLMDVDFVPMAGLYQHLRQSIRLINPYPQKKCLVVPAFETQRYRGSAPRDKRTLLTRLSHTFVNGDITPFRSREWPSGHRATNYSRWKVSDAPYEVEWESDYEPYLVVHRSVPKYDTRFSGFGWNKVSHSVQLRALGFRLLVLPAAFVVHTPHAPSQDISAFRRDAHYRICLAILKQEFMNDLKRRFNATFDSTKDTPKSDILLGQAKSISINGNKT